MPSASPTTSASTPVTSSTRLVEGAVPLGVSVGVAMVDGARRDTPEQLVERADTAMYEAKRRGGDRVAVADDASPVPEAG